MTDREYLDNFEALLTDGLVKLVQGAGLLGEAAYGVKLPASPDIDELWDRNLIKDYVADAVCNFNEYPEAAISWAGFLGMAVAHYWDSDWSAHKDDVLRNFYGKRGFDDMDENILQNCLGMELESPEAKKTSDTLLSCALAVLGLIQHEGIETQTEQGFYILARCYTVLYKIGAAIQLFRNGYVVKTIN